jgi:hypothetical protein
VAWYYDPGHDGRADGRHLEWRDDDDWAAFDPELHRSLKALPERSIAAVEALDFWPSGTLFHRQPVPRFSRYRSEWIESVKAQLEPADVVFLDPDNSLGKVSRKHATLNEVSDLRAPGRAVAFIKFPNFSRKHNLQLEELHSKLNAHLGPCEPTTLTTSVALPNRQNPRLFHPRIRWFTVIDGDETLHRQLGDFADRLSQLPRVRAEVHR